MVVNLIFERNFPAARREVARIFELNPTSLGAIRGLSWIELVAGNCAVSQSRGSGRLADGKRLCGQPEKARRQIAALEKKSETEFVSPHLLAEAYGTLKDADHTIAYLEKSAEQKESTLLYLEIDTLLDWSAASDWSRWRSVADGAPGVIRTRDLLVRSQTLYPTELRALW